MAPTGAGKSLLSLVAHRALAKRVHTLVSTVRLQDQMRTSYSHAPILKGQDHYSCLIMPGLSVSQAPCQVGFKCALKGECDYFVDRKSAYYADYAVFNYALYSMLSINNPIMPPDIMFCDEAHLVEREIENFLSTTITNKDIATEGWHHPSGYTTMEMADWADGLLPSMYARVEEGRKKVFGAVGSSSGSTVLAPKQYARSIAKHNRNRYLLRTLQLMVEAGLDTERGKSWVTERSTGAITLRPVHVDEYSHHLFDLAPRVVLMSATMSKADVDRLGVTDYDYIEVPSTYEANRRPIHYRPVGSVNQYNEYGMMPDLVAEIDGIIEHHSKMGDKGIIHTVSFDRANNIRSLSHNQKLMLTHTSRNKDEIIAKFKDSAEPLVLLSPSIIEGEDFPGDECHYIILPKIPFLSLGDAVVRERREIDKSWYSWKAVVDVIQGAGRGMRSQEDHCVIYILDSNFEKIVEEHGKEIPHWFLEAIVGLDEEFKKSVGME